MKKTNQKGFTLIELLVVIAIIGLLSTMAVVSLNSARQKARDAKRVSDVKQLSTLLSLGASELPNATLRCGAIATACADNALASTVVGARVGTDVNRTLVDPSFVDEFPKFVDPTGSAACVHGTTIVPCLYSITTGTALLEDARITFLTEGVVGGLTADNTHTIDAEGVLVD